MNDDQRLQFAMRFAAMDLDALREGDELNLRDDLERFIVGEEGRPRIVYSLHPGHRPRDLTKDALAAIQAHTKAVLARFADRDGKAIAVPIHAQIAVTGNRDGGALVMMLGPAADLYFHALAAALGGSGVADRIRRCPVCGGVFLRIRRQEYCSRRCGMRVFMQKYRSKPKARVQMNRDQRKRYAAKVRKEKAARLKVGRKE